MVDIPLVRGRWCSEQATLWLALIGSVIALVVTLRIWEEGVLEGFEHRFLLSLVSEELEVAMFTGAFLEINPVSVFLHQSVLDGLAFFGFDAV